MPLPDPTVYPDLPWSLDAQILVALREQLLADEPLRTVLPQDDQVPIQELAGLLRTETLPAATVLGLSILATEERETTSSFGASQTTIVQLALATPAPARWGDTGELLRSRIIGQLRRVVRQNHGVLLDPDGGRLTEAVTRIQQIRLDATQLPSNAILTLISVEYRSTIDLELQEVLE